MKTILNKPFCCNGVGDMLFGPVSMGECAVLWPLSTSPRLCSLSESGLESSSRRYPHLSTRSGLPGHPGLTRRPASVPSSSANDAGWPHDITIAENIKNVSLEFNSHLWAENKTIGDDFVNRYWPSLQVFENYWSFGNNLNWNIKPSIYFLC